MGRKRKRNTGIVVLVALAGVALLIAGCARSTYIPIGTIDSELEPKPASYDVPIYLMGHETKLERTYREIGVIEAYREAITVFEQITIGDIIPLLQEKARQIGADAVIQVRQVPSQAGRGVSSCKILGMAVVYIETM